MSHILRAGHVQSMFIGATHTKTRMVAAIVILLVSAHTLSAQEPGWTFEAYGMLAQPALGLHSHTGHTEVYSLDWSRGFGASAVVSYDLNSSLAATLRTGYIVFPGEVKALPLGIILTSPDHKIVPLLLGGRYFVTHGAFQLFLGIEAGHYRQTHSSSQSAFGLDPNLGFRIRLADGVDLGIEAKYEVVFTTTAIDWSSSSPSNQMRQEINGGFSWLGLMVGVTFH